MEKINSNRILKHARNLRILIIVYSFIYIAFALWDIQLKDNYSVDLGVKIYHILLFGLPITAYAVWYILNISPKREQNKTGTVLGLLFFGVIGLWMVYPRESKLLQRLKRKQSRFNLES